MSHTGRRFIRSVLRNTTRRPRHQTIEDEIIEKGGKLEEQELIGEFKGNGVTVLTGLSTSSSLDIVNILNNNEKGVIIGYTPNDPYFQLFRNDGLGTKTVTIFTDKFKDELYHRFRITVKENNKVEIEFDGAETVYTTKIPSISDTLYVINYSVY